MRAVLQLEYLFIVILILIPLRYKMSSFLKDKSILVTGGTGSFGSKFVEEILTKYSDIKRLVIYSRDELKQFELSQKFPMATYPQIRYFIGDIRDADRLKRACEGIDIIIHAAALKQVPENVLVTFLFSNIKKWFLKIIKGYDSNFKK
jgi:FlaA1/EpsC-like NDP-sugar epimerase